MSKVRCKDVDKSEWFGRLWYIMYWRIIVEKKEVENIIWGYVIKNFYYYFIKEL